MLAIHHDLAASLLSMTSRTRGEFTHTEWSLYPAFREDPTDTVVASLHEWNHAHLNATTAYGGLLSVAAVLAAPGGSESQQWATLLTDLVARCRDTHESYATFMSIAAMPNSATHVALLADSPTYLHYYQTAVRAATGVPGKFLQSVAVSAVARLCMQPAALEAIGNRGLANFRLSDLRGAEFPDARLGRVLDLAHSSVWLAAFDDAWQLRPDLVITPKIEDFDRQVADWIEQKAQESLLTANMHLAQCFYNAIASQAAGIGVQSLAFNGQTPLLAKLLADTNDVFHELPSMLGANPEGAIAEPLEVSADLTRLFMFERLKVTQTVATASVRLYRDYPLAEWQHEAITMTALDDTIFVPLRSAESIREHYRLDPASADVLREASPGLVPFVRWREFAFGEGSVVRHLLIRDAVELHGLRIDAKLYGLQMTANVSLSHAARETNVLDAEWWSALEPLQPTFLCDVDPEALLSTLNPASLRYFRVTLNDALHHAVVLIDLQDEVPYVIPCSPAAGAGLISWLSATFGLQGLQEHALPLSDVRRLTLGATIRHLYEEETTLDLLGLLTVTNGDGHEPT